MLCHRFRCNLTKLTTKSRADWQCCYLLRAAVVSTACSRGILMWFLASLVGDLAGFLFLLCPIGLPPPPVFPLLVSVTGAWTPGKEAYGWVAGIACHAIATWSRGCLAGFPWKPLDIPGNQPPFCDLVADCGNLTHNILFDIKNLSTPKWLACVFQHFDNF